MQIKQSGCWKASIHLHQKKISDVKAFCLMASVDFFKTKYILAFNALPKSTFIRSLHSKHLCNLKVRQLIEEFKDNVLVKFQNK